MERHIFNAIDHVKKLKQQATLERITGYLRTHCQIGKINAESVKNTLEELVVENKVITSVSRTGNIGYISIKHAALRKSTSSKEKSTEQNVSITSPEDMCNGSALSDSNDEPLVNLKKNIVKKRISTPKTKQTNFENKDAKTSTPSVSKHSDSTKVKKSMSSPVITKSFPITDIKSTIDSTVVSTSSLSKTTPALPIVSTPLTSLVSTTASSPNESLPAINEGPQTFKREVPPLSSTVKSLIPIVNTVSCQVNKASTKPTSAPPSPVLATSPSLPEDSKSPKTPKSGSSLSSAKSPNRIVLSHELRSKVQEWSLEAMRALSTEYKLTKSGTIRVSMVHNYLMEHHPQYRDEVSSDMIDRGSPCFKRYYKILRRCLMESVKEGHITTDNGYYKVPNSSQMVNGQSGSDHMEIDTDSCDKKSVSNNFSSISPIVQSILASASQDEEENSAQIPTETEKAVVIKQLKMKKIAKPIPVCSFCLGDEHMNRRTNCPEDMVACGDCGICGHPTCLQWPPKLYTKVCKLRWQCLSCKKCSFCDQPDEDLLLCDGCDRGFHTYCCNPPLKKAPKGNWLCNICQPSRLATGPVQPLHCDILTTCVHPSASPRQRHPSNVTSASSKSKHASGDTSRSKHASGDTGKHSLQDGLTQFFTPTKKRMSRLPKYHQFDDFIFTDIKGRPRSIGGPPKPSSDSKVSKENKEALARQSAARKLVKKSKQTRVTTLPSPEAPSKEATTSAQTLKSPIYKAALVVQQSRKRKLNKPKLSTENKQKRRRVDKTSVLDMESEDETWCGNETLNQVEAKLEAEDNLLQVTEFDRNLFTTIQHQVNQSIPFVSDFCGTSLPAPSADMASMECTDSSSSTPSTHRESEVASSLPPPSVTRYPPQIQLGRYSIETWYSAPYPSEYARLGTLYICEYCLKYIRSSEVYIRHMDKCTTHFPPGNEIYRCGNVSVWEVDGYASKLYCQNLCLLAKLFLDHKTLYYDVEPFLFYVATICDEFSCHLVGYFSKEKLSSKRYNLSCIMVLPPYQKQAFGRFLIDFSYLLSRVEGIPGSPEKPLSALGQLSYESYWRSKLLPYITSMLHPPAVKESLQNGGDHYDKPSDTKPDRQATLTISAVSKATGIEPNDIALTLQQMASVQLSKQGKPMLVFDPYALSELRTKYDSRSSSWIPLDESCLRWSPLIHPREQDDSGEQTDNSQTATNDNKDTPSHKKKQDVNRSTNGTKNGTLSHKKKNEKLSKLTSGPNSNKPKITPTTPKTSTTTPKTAITTTIPKTSISTTTPKTSTSNTTSKSGITTLKTAITNPKTPAITQKTSTISPKTSTVSPKTSTISPKTSTISPKTSTTSPKTSTISPKTPTATSKSYVSAFDSASEGDVDECKPQRPRSTRIRRPPSSVMSPRKSVRRSVRTQEMDNSLKQIDPEPSPVDTHTRRSSRRHSMDHLPLSSPSSIHTINGQEPDDKIGKEVATPERSHRSSLGSTPPSKVSCPSRPSPSDKENGEDASIEVARRSDSGEESLLLSPDVLGSISICGSGLDLSSLGGGDTPNPSNNKEADLAAFVDETSNEIEMTGPSDSLYNVSLVEEDECNLAANNLLSLSSSSKEDTPIASIPLTWTRHLSLEMQSADEEGNLAAKNLLALCDKSQDYTPDLNAFREDVLDEIIESSSTALTRDPASDFITEPDQFSAIIDNSYPIVADDQHIISLTDPIALDSDPNSVTDDPDLITLDNSFSTSVVYDPGRFTLNNIESNSAGDDPDSIPIDNLDTNSQSNNSYSILSIPNSDVPSEVKSCGEVTCTDGIQTSLPSDFENLTFVPDLSSIIDNPDPTSIVDNSDPTSIDDNSDPTSIDDNPDQTSMVDDPDRTSNDDITDPTSMVDNPDLTSIVDNSDPTSIDDNPDQTSMVDDPDRTSVDDITDPTSMVDNCGLTSIDDNPDLTSIVNNSDPISRVDNSDLISIDDNHNPTAMLDNSDPTFIVDNSNPTSMVDNPDLNHVLDVNNTENLSNSITSPSSSLPYFDAYSSPCNAEIEPSETHKETGPSDVSSIYPSIQDSKPDSPSQIICDISHSHPHPTSPDESISLTEDIQIRDLSNSFPRPLPSHPFCEMAEDHTVSYQPQLMPTYSSSSFSPNSRTPQYAWANDELYQQDYSCSSNQASDVYAPYPPMAYQTSLSANDLHSASGQLSVSPRIESLHYQCHRDT